MRWFSFGESLTHINHKWKHQTKNYLAEISKLTHEIKWSWDFKIMLFHETILKSKDTEKSMAQLLSFNRKIIQTSVFGKPYRKRK